MYKFDKEQVLDPVFLTKLIRKFKREYVPQFEKKQKYYEIKTEILHRTMTDGKPNNKLAHGFCRYITNMATSYFAGKPIRYLVEDNAYKDALYEVFKNNYINAINFESSKEASKKGIGFLLMFINEQGKLRIKKLNAEDIIPVYSRSLDEFLETAIHIWYSYDIQGDLEAEYADVYDDKLIYHYRRKSGEIVFSEYDKPEVHQLCDIPVIVIWNNEDQMGDFEGQISLNDAYDRGQSDTANDMDYFTDAYLCISGASSLESSLSSEETEDTDTTVRNLRKDRILFLDEKGQAEWLIKQINDTANENYKNRIYNDIFFLSQVPALSDESFAGNLSGISIRYKLTGLEELSIMKENCFRSAQTKMISIITEWLNTKMNKKWDPDTVEQKYERNFIENISDIIDNVKNLENIVSRETQLGMLPKDIVTDPEEELVKINEESLAEQNLPKINLDEL